MLSLTILFIVGGVWGTLSLTQVKQLGQNTDRGATWLACDGIIRRYFEYTGCPKILFRLVSVQQCSRFYFLSFIKFNLFCTNLAYEYLQG